MSAKELFIIAFYSIIVFGTGMVSSDLRNDYYKVSCPQAEQIVKAAVKIKVLLNPTLPAKLLRLFFHDCGVRGCDASILLDPVNATNKVEKEAEPNLSVAGYDLIDDIKSKLERRCPNTVSCADILALATRDAISFPFNQPTWDVPTGRRDGRYSRASEAVENLPSSFSDFKTLKQNFADKGLDVNDLVVLSGAHTIGVAHCTDFSKRLYNFTGKNDQDPSLHPIYAIALKLLCPKFLQNKATIVAMDPLSFLTFDAQYFTTVKQNKGLLQSDAALLTDPNAAQIVTRMQTKSTFFSEFGKSMKKMGAISVLTGSEGEIRKNCRMVN